MDEDRYRGEPALLAPWPALLLVALILGSYVVQSAMGGEALSVRYGFTPADLDNGPYTTLVTYQFLHGNWPHVVMNAVFALAMGPPVSRLLGEGAGGALVFLLFYLGCGVLAALGFAAFHPHVADSFLIGASGGVSGLFGAAIRLLGRHGRLASLRDRQVLTMAAVIMVLNVVVGVIGLAPGAGAGPVAIAWEAHLAGFAAGLIMIGPLAAAMRRGR